MNPAAGERFYWKKTTKLAACAGVYRISKQRMDWSTSLFLGDAFAVVASFVLAFWSSRYIDAVPTPHAGRITLLNCAFVGGLTLYVFHRAGLYRWEVFLRTPALLQRLPLALAGTAVLCVVIRLLVAPVENFSYLPFLFLYFAICLFVVPAARGIVRFLDFHYLRSIRVEHIAFVGWNKRVANALLGLADAFPRLHTMEGYFVDESQPGPLPPPDSGYREIGPLRDLESLLTARKITALVVDQASVSPTELRRMADICADQMVNFRVIPAAFDIWAARLSVRLFRGVPLIGIRDLYHDRFGNRVLKRAVDIVGALVGLALSAPIIAVLSFLIRRESPGPVIFRQTRLGLRGRPFEILKLRSMRLDAEQTKGAVWAVENDPRRLKIGAFMRKWNLDELPQFWNVLKGEMTLVGPRPERPNFVEDFRDSVRYYNLRHSCKPGVTGWAAVHGLRGNTSLEDRLDYDLYYIENWSLLLDFKIMLMTLAPPKNAY